MRTQDGKQASSATYREATNQVAKKLKVDPNHGKYPRDDFREIIELIPEKQRKKAVKWYKMGIKRGFAKATDMMLSGEIYKKGSAVFCPNAFEITVKTKFADEEWVRRTIEIRASDIGFE